MVKIKLHAKALGGHPFSSALPGSRKKDVNSEAKTVKTDCPQSRAQNSTSSSGSLSKSRSHFHQAHNKSLSSSIQLHVICWCILHITNVYQNDKCIPKGRHRFGVMLSISISQMDGKAHCFWMKTLLDAGSVWWETCWQALFFLSPCLLPSLPLFCSVSLTLSVNW